MLKSFFVRLLSGIVILAMYVLMYCFRSTIGLNILISLIAFGAVFEFCKFTGKTERESEMLLPFACAYAVITPLFNIPLITTVIFTICVFGILIFKFTQVDISKLFFAGFVSVIITLSMTCITLLQNYDSIDYLLPLCFGSAVTDVFAYLTGILIGKHKLSPVVSPKKSVEGAIGGTLFTAVAFALYAVFANSYFNTDFTVVQAIVAGLIFAVFAQIGDLTESAIKRKYNVKDSGNLIPGHGGIYDRFDSWITTAPLVLVIASLL